MDLLGDLGNADQLAAGKLHFLRCGCTVHHSSRHGRLVHVNSEYSIVFCWCVCFTLDCHEFGPAFGAAFSFFQ